MILERSAIPHFHRSVVAAGPPRSTAEVGPTWQALSRSLRELGGLVRIAGDLAAEDGSPYTTREHVALARSIAKPLEQQVADRMIERRQDWIDARQQR